MSDAEAGQHTSGMDETDFAHAHPSGAPLDPARPLEVAKTKAHAVVDALVREADPNGEDWHDQAMEKVAGLPDWLAPEVVKERLATCRLDDDGTETEVPFGLERCPAQPMGKKNRLTGTSVPAELQGKQADGFGRPCGHLQQRGTSEGGRGHKISTCGQVRRRTMAPTAGGWKPGQLGIKVCFLAGRPVRPPFLDPALSEEEAKESFARHGAGIVISTGKRVEDGAGGHVVSHVMLVPDDEASATSGEQVWAGRNFRDDVKGVMFERGVRPSSVDGVEVDWQDRLQFQSLGSAFVTGGALHAAGLRLRLRGRPDAVSCTRAGSGGARSKVTAARNEKARFPRRRAPKRRRGSSGAGSARNGPRRRRRRW